MTKSAVRVCPSEHMEAAMLTRWAIGAERIYPELALLYAIPNGGKRSIKTARDLKAEGVKAGVPDYCLPVPCGGFNGMYLELKRQHGGRVEPEQRGWLAALEAQGYRTEVARGWEAARDALRDYLATDGPNLKDSHGQL